MPSILWGYRTTRRSPTEESPFRMAFGTEAVLSIELEIPTFRVQTFDEMINEVGMRAQLDGIEEVRETAQKRIAAYQQRAARYYDKKVKHKVFYPGDLVCRKLEATRSEEGRGKLTLNWEDPVHIAQVLGNRAYKLEALDGELIPRTWNANNLRKFFP